MRSGMLKAGGLTFFEFEGGPSLGTSRRADPQARPEFAMPPQVIYDAFALAPADIEGSH